MLEKLKNFAKSTQAIIGYFFTVLMLIIAGLLFKNKRLEEKVEEEQKDSKIKELDGQQQVIDKQAKDSLDEYEATKDAYLKKDK